MSGIVTLQQLLEFNGKFDPTLLWELLHALAFHIKKTLKDPLSWQSGPVLLICSSRIMFNKDGSINIEEGSIGEYDDCLYVAPEYYNTDTKLASPTVTELIYVYCLGMAVYSAAEFGATEEMDLPCQLEDTLISMVNEVAESRTTLTNILQACQANIPLSRRSALNALILSYLDKKQMTTSLALGLPPPPPLPPVTSLPPHTDTALPPDTSLPTSQPPEGSLPGGAHTNSLLDSNPYTSFAELDADPGTSHLNNLNNTGTMDNSKANGGRNVSHDDRYSNSQEMATPTSRGTSTVSRDHSSISRDPSISSSEPENPYGVNRALCPQKLCVIGQCTHTDTDISAMYSTVQKTRTHSKAKRTSSGRVDGFRLDTSISANSPEPNQPIQLTMRRAGKPVIVQFPSNKRFQVPGLKDDSIRGVFSMVMQRLSIEDSSLFGIMHSPIKGISEFIPPSRKLKLYAPDKWKSDASPSPPVSLKLAVKFFPPAPHKFINQVTRLQFFLSIRNLILEGTYEVTKDTAFDLAALSLQADIGDYYDRSSCSNQYFDPHTYVPPEVMSTMSYQYVSKEIPMLHSKLDDMSQNEAVIRYLQIVSKIPDYGVHFFQVRERNPPEALHNYLGVSLQHVILYELPRDTVSRRGPLKKFPWNKISNLSYKNKTFIMDVLCNGKKGRSERRYNFETESTKVSRIIMNLCADSHKFYIKLKSMLPPSEEQEPPFSVRDYTPSPRSVITNKRVSRESSREEREKHDTGLIPAKEREATYSLSSSGPLSKRPLPNNQMSQKFACLTKTDSSQSLGMTIIGGDGSHGIYIDKLATGGLAHLDGRIRPGDMLLSINGQSLKNTSHKDAVNLIRCQPSRVELELLETAGPLPYDVESGSGSSHSMDSRKEPVRETRSAPSPWFVASQSSSIKRDMSLPKSLQNRDMSLPKSLQNRMVMQERYNLVREPDEVGDGARRSSTEPEAEDGARRSSTPSYLTEPRDDRAGNFMRSEHRTLTRGDEAPTPGCHGDRDSPLSSPDSSTNNILHSNNSFVKSDEGRSTPNKSKSLPLRIFTVYLTKQRGSLGLSIKADKGVTYVKDVFPNGPAAVSGMIEKGDAILSVNGVDLANTPTPQVMALLQGAPDNVTLVMSWATNTTAKPPDQWSGIGMQFRVALERGVSGLERGVSGFGFSTRNTYMGSDSFIRVKAVLPGGPAAINGSLEEGDILLSVGGYSLENVTEQILSNILTSVKAPAQFIVYRPDTIRTFNPRKYEAGRILPLTIEHREDLLGFVLCAGYPYYRNSEAKSLINPNDRLIRLGSFCCQGIKTAQIEAVIKDTKTIEAQIFRPCDFIDNEEASVGRLEKQTGNLSIENNENIVDQLMKDAVTIILNKADQGLGFSLLGQQDGKRIVHGVTVKTVLDVGAANEEGQLRPGDLIIMVNGRSMVGITQNKALSVIRKCTGEVVLTVQPGHLRNDTSLSASERRLVDSNRTAE